MVVFKGQIGRLTPGFLDHLEIKPTENPSKEALKLKSMHSANYTNCDQTDQGVQVTGCIEIIAIVACMQDIVKIFSFKQAVTNIAIVAALKLLF